MLPRAAPPDLLARLRLAGAHERFERSLQILHIRRGAFVDDDEIHRQPLHMPVLVRMHQLPHQRHVFDIVDAHQQDRQIARHAMRPERRGANAARRGHRGDTALQRSEPGRNDGSLYSI